MALFCSDVQGAFDRVSRSRSRLCAKLQASGIPRKLAAVLASWLDVRKSVVLVEGCMSDEAVLKHMVFQGTVLGPLLWNISFEDARRAVANVGFEEVVYADDLNAYTEVISDLSSVAVYNECRACQQEMHS